MKQLGFKGTNGWGGKRKKAGRPNRSGTVNHMARPEVDFRKPLQITHKLQPGLATLRRKHILKAFQRCAARAKHFEMHVIHFSLISNHIHMLVEARDKKALEQGMRSLASRMGKLVAFCSNKKGPVFKGRYHLSVIKNPTQMKRSLYYVLLNQAKHSKMLEHMDPFSSAKYFPDWRRLMGKLWNPVFEWEEVNISSCDEAGLSPPRSWLMRDGWNRAG
jgi:putative transposase